MRLSGAGPKPCVRHSRRPSRPPEKSACSPSVVPRACPSSTSNAATPVFMLRTLLSRRESFRALARGHDADASSGMRWASRECPIERGFPLTDPLTDPQKPTGLTDEEAASRLRQDGYNEIAAA